MDMERSGRSSYKSPELNWFEIEVESVLCDSPENGGIESGGDEGDL